MEKIIDRPNYLRGSSLPFQEIEEGFDDWVRWLDSIMQAFENSSMTQPREQRVDSEKEFCEQETHSLVV